MKLLVRINLKLRELMGFPEAILANKVLSQKPQQLHIYGMGIIGKELMQHLVALGYESRIAGLFDSKAEHNPFDVAGKSVSGPSALAPGRDDTVVIASVEFEQAIIAQLDDKLGGVNLITVSK